MILNRVCRKCSITFLWRKGQGKGKFCSILCACRARNTKTHQKKAGKVGGSFNASRRGLYTKPSSYIKEFGRHQHRVVMEKVLGRKLKSKEIVHHKDNNKHNNHPSNLEVMSQAEHARLHFTKVQ